MTLTAIERKKLRSLANQAKKLEQAAKKLANDTGKELKKQMKFLVI